jgi:hypothetical protein
MHPFAGNGPNNAYLQSQVHENKIPYLNPPVQISLQEFEQGLSCFDTSLVDFEFGA